MCFSVVLLFIGRTEQAETRTDSVELRVELTESREIEVDDTVECILHSVLSEILRSSSMAKRRAALGIGVHFMPRLLCRLEGLACLLACAA